MVPLAGAAAALDIEMEDVVPVVFVDTSGVVMDVSLVILPSAVRYI